jgi:flavin-dependent dehydrogenase
VTGVKTGDEEIAADIVIDATGRGSRSPEWLAALGYPKPEEERVEVALAYIRGSPAGAANTSSATAP